MNGFRDLDICELSFNRISSVHSTALPQVIPFMHMNRFSVAFNYLHSDTYHHHRYPLDKCTQQIATSLTVQVSDGALPSLILIFSAIVLHHSRAQNGWIIADIYLLPPYQLQYHIWHVASISTPKAVFVISSDSIDEPFSEGPCNHTPQWLFWCLILGQSVFICFLVWLFMYEIY